MQLKAQSAMEYLVTYGWAIVGVVILVGALSYFGIFRPEDSLPEFCQLGGEIECEDYRVFLDQSSGKEFMKVQVKNIERQDLYIEKITCTLGDEYTGVPTDNPSDDIYISNKATYPGGGDYAVLITNVPTNITCGGAGTTIFSLGTKKKVKLSIIAFNDIDFKKNIKGEIFAKVS